MQFSHKRAGSILNVLLAILGLGGTLTFMTLSTIPKPRLTEDSAARLKANTIGTMVALGLDPEALAAVGVNANQAAGLFDDVEEHIEEHGPELLNKEQALRQAIAQQQATERGVSRGKIRENPADRDQGPQAVKTARSERNTAEAAVWAVAMEGLNLNQATALRTIKKHRASGLPVEYLTIERTPDEIEQIRMAIRGFTPPEPDQSDWVGAPNQAAPALDSGPVTTAQSYLQTNKASVSAAWEQKCRQ